MLVSGGANECVGMCMWRENWCGVVANKLDCDIKVNSFELPSCYYVHFRTENLEKGMNTTNLRQ